MAGKLETHFIPAGDGLPCVGGDDVKNGTSYRSTVTGNTIVVLGRTLDGDDRIFVKFGRRGEYQYVRSTDRLDRGTIWQELPPGAVNITIK